VEQLDIRVTLARVLFIQEKIVSTVDVLIVGGGPAGATAAYHLAKAGIEVMVCEMSPFPREKVCGDGLIADSLAALERMGLAERVRHVGYVADGMEFWSPSRINDVVPIEFATLKREVLDDMVLRRAQSVGAKVAYKRVVDLIPVAGGVQVMVEGAGHINARIAVVATGAAKQIPLQREREKVTPPYAASVRCYVRSNYEVNLPVISYDRTILPGYGWIFPLGQGEYNVGCYSITSGRYGKKIDLREMFTIFMRTFPVAQNLREYSVAITKPRGSVLRCNLNGLPPKSDGNVLFVGETLGTTFSFTGEGIGKAMETGELAAQVVIDAVSAGDMGVLKEYVTRIEGMRSRYHAYGLAERWLSNSLVCDLLGLGAKHSTAVKRAIAGVINETASPQALFSARGIVSTLFRRE
jgi:geranylgeranyl reductase family protein